MDTELDLQSEVKVTIKMIKQLNKYISTHSWL